MLNFENRYLFYLGNQITFKYIFAKCLNNAMLSTYSIHINLDESLHPKTPNEYLVLFLYVSAKKQ